MEIGFTLLRQTPETTFLVYAGSLLYYSKVDVANSANQRQTSWLSRIFFFRHLLIVQNNRQPQMMKYKVIFSLFPDTCLKSSETSSHWKA